MMNVVLADDELLTLAAIRVALEQSGLDVAVIGEATNGLGIVELCMHNQVDVVITDIRMPAMDGIALIKMLKEIRSPAKIVVLSAYRDFDYAQQAINNGAYAYLLKPLRKEQLVELLDDLYRQNGATHTDAPVSGRDIELVLSCCHGLSPETLPPGLWPILHGEYRVVLLQCETAHEGETLPHRLQRTIEERLRFFTESCPVLWGRRMALFFPDGTKTNFIAETVRDTAALQTVLPVSIGISGPAMEVAGLPEAVEQCRRSLSACFFSEERVSVCIFAPELQGVPSSGSRRLSSLETDFLAAIRVCAPDQGLETLEQLRHYFFMQPGLSSKTVKRFYLNLLYSIRALPPGKDADTNAPELFDEYMESIARSDRLTSIHGYLAELLQAVFGSTIGTGDDSLPKVRRIQHYCEHNYHLDISLDLVSDHVGLTGNYLCHLFKEHTGIGFWDYLTDLRIEKAKALLAEEGCRANRVGRQVGYHNPGHFGRVFKSRVGMTPIEYKRSLYPG